MESDSSVFNKVHIFSVPAMAVFIIGLLTFRVFLSIVGVIGNTILVLALIQNRLSRLKSFEVFLLGLAVSNLEEIFIVDIYDIITLLDETSFSKWECQTMKFLTMFGEIASINFTVLISIFRYQKLRDADKRGNLPIYLDNIRSAWLVSGFCVFISLLISIPTYTVDLDGHMEKDNRNSSKCSPDFFHCHEGICPLLSRLYKYIFIFMCNLLPVLIVTFTGCLIIKVLLGQRNKVKPAVKKSKDKMHRSTVSVLSATALFQASWTAYLVLYLALDADDFDGYYEVEFCLAILYTAISPYVYGIGTNLFSFKTLFAKK